MEQVAIYQFLIKHWPLVAAWVAILLGLIIVELRIRMYGPKYITVTGLSGFLKEHSTAQLIDIRAEADYSAGHIAGSINLKPSEMKKDHPSFNKYIERPIVLVCRSGQSVVAVGLDLKKQGIDQVYILQGGLQAWQSEGMPLVK